MDYGRFGWSVVPVEPRGERSVVSWQIYRHRQPELTEIGDWFNRWPGANLAIVTGVISALVVLVIDPRRGGKSSLARLEQQQGPLPETVEAVLGDARQLYFSHPGGIVSERLDLAPGIDLHGDGGYLVAPPSVHASGESYRWARSPEVFHPEPLPAWLLSIPAEERGEPEEPLVQWLAPLQAEVAEGGRSDALAILCGHLLSKGVAPEVVLELMLCWNAVRCRPPLEANLVAQAVERIAYLRKDINSTAYQPDKYDQ